MQKMKSVLGYRLIPIPSYRQILFNRTFQTHCIYLCWQEWLRQTIKSRKWAKYNFVIRYSARKQNKNMKRLFFLWKLNPCQIFFSYPSVTEFQPLTRFPCLPIIRNNRISTDNHKFNQGRLSYIMKIQILPRIVPVRNCQFI